MFPSLVARVEIPSERLQEWRAYQVRVDLKAAYEKAADLRASIDNLNTQPQTRLNLAKMELLTGRLFTTYAEIRRLNSGHEGKAQ